MVQRICVCGAGTMGSGIAQAAATAGIQVILYELNPAILETASRKMDNVLQKLADKGKINADEKSRILRRIQYSHNLQDCRADVIIEAVLENPAVKVSLFQQLAEQNSSHTIFATNTSSLSITGIAQETTFPERIIGMHFFNPAPVMKLVEVVVTKFTDSLSKSTILQLAKDMGKTPVLCKDSPGFIVNRVARPFYIESLRLAEEGIAPERIDTLLESAGFKMGPFRLMDLIGNDINYAVSESVYEQLGKPERLQPSPLQKSKVDKKELGKKSGKGFYNYS